MKRSRHIEQTHILGAIFGVIFLVFVGALVYASASGYTDPADRQFDYISGTMTYTDRDGRRLIQSRDGSVRELTPR